METLRDQKIREGRSLIFLVLFTTVVCGTVVVLVTILSGRSFRNPPDIALIFGSAFLEVGLLLGFPIMALFSSARLERKYPLPTTPPGDEPWRAETHFWLIEDDKRKLGENELRLRDLLHQETLYRERTKNEDGTSDLYLLLALGFTNWYLRKLGTPKLYPPSVEELKNNIRFLKETIARRYRGDLQPEIRDWEDAVRKNKRRRSDCSAPEDRKEALDLDERLIDLERQLTILLEWKDKNQTPADPLEALRKTFTQKIHHGHRAQTFTGSDKKRSSVEQAMEEAQDREHFHKEVDDHPTLSAESKAKIHQHIDQVYADVAAGLSIYKDSE